jgi:acyl-CoA reductase-like NAD-dependent aldehyde dehydrogenase
MELGGKDPAIVLASADLEAFESTFMRSVFQSVGQGCIATERFIVHRSLLPTLVPALKARVDGLRLASSLAGGETAVDCGSMISDARFDDLERRVELAVEAGAELICGGARQHREDGVGAFFQPTLLTNVDPESALATEEVFGPIMLLIPFDTVDEAIAIANASRYGCVRSSGPLPTRGARFSSLTSRPGVFVMDSLGAAVYGRDKKEAMYVARELECGMVSTNDFGAFPARRVAEQTRWRASPRSSLLDRFTPCPLEGVFYLNQAMPFGGCKASGYGRFGGPEGLRGLCNLKSVIVDRFHGRLQTGIPPAVGAFPSPLYRRPPSSSL